MKLTKVEVLQKRTVPGIPELIANTKRSLPEILAKQLESEGIVKITTKRKRKEE